VESENRVLKKKMKKGGGGGVWCSKSWTAFKKKGKPGTGWVLSGKNGLRGDQRGGGSKEEYGFGCVAVVGQP